MTTIAAVRARSRVIVPADTLALGLLGAFGVVLAAATWGTWGDLDNDTGHDFVAGARVARGELPYIDFPYWYGPLAPALLGLVARTGGAGVAPFVAFGLIVAGAIVLAGYALARRHAGPLGAAAATAITIPVAFAPNQFSFVLPHTSAATLGLLALLGTLLALGRGRPLAAGTCLGLVALTKPEFALAALAAAAAWLLVARDRRTAALVAAPALAIPAAVYGAFLTAVPARALLRENLYPADFLAGAGNAILRARAPLTPESVAVLGGRLALYAAGAAVLLLVARLLAARGRARRAALGLAGSVGAAVVAASFANPEALRHGLQLAWGWIPAGALAAAALIVLRIRRGDRTASNAAALAGLTALTVFAATTYAGFFLYAPHAQTAAYAVPLAAVLVVRLHLVELARSPQARALGLVWVAFLAAAGLGLTLKDARAEGAAVRGPGGALRESSDYARAYGAALGWLEERTKPGEPVLLAPLLTSLYTLSGRENPLPDISLLPGTLPDDRAEAAAVAQLERAGVRVAVLDRRAFPGFGHTSFGGSFHPLLARWVERRFVRAATATAGDPAGPQLELWVRRGP